MNQFSYSDIFATKGIEYLVVITFLALLIPFWLILNKKTSVANRIQQMLGTLSAKILRIPQGLFYSNNHTWLFMEKSGAAKVGLDDLLLHITGEVKLKNLRSPGEMINKGDLLTDIHQNGKNLRILSPVSGRILELNAIMNESSNALNIDPYGNGWIYKIKPSNWISDVKSCHFAEEATNWSTTELERFKDFLSVSMKNYSPETSMVILQDGGEICDHSLSTLPGTIWKDFEKEFLDLHQS